MVLHTDVDDVFDDSVAQKLIGDGAGFREVGVGDLAINGEFEALTDSHVGEVRSAVSQKRAVHGFPCRIEKVPFGHDLNDDGRHLMSPDA